MGGKTKLCVQVPTAHHRHSNQKHTMAPTNFQLRLMTAQLNRIRGEATRDDKLVLEWSVVMDESTGRWKVTPSRSTLLKFYTRVTKAMDAIIGDRGSSDDEIILEIYEKTKELRDRAYDEILGRRPVTAQHSLIGKEVLKEFNAGNFKGTITSLDAPGFLVKYEDGDSEHLSEEEIREILYTPPSMTLMDRVEYIETSGNKAQSFSKMVKEVVNGRPRMAEQLAIIFMELGETNITTRGRFSVGDIGPWLWAEMGRHEMEKLHWAKRILEALIHAS